MFGDQLAVGKDARAPALAMKLQIARLREIALKLSQVAFVGAAVILFAIWLMAPNGRAEAQSGLSPPANCQSLGPVGGACPDAAAR